MTKKQKQYTPRAKGETLEARVKETVRAVWNQIAADAEELLTGASREERLEMMVELCLDADRPVTMGWLSEEDYDLVCKERMNEADTWAREVLKGLV